MNPINNKSIRIITLIAITVGAFIMIVFFVFSKTYSDYKLFDVLFVPMELRTTIEHQKSLGIEAAKISSAEEKQLESMMDESVKAQLEYYSTKKDESLEKVRNLYLPNGFEQYKEDVKQQVFYYEDLKNGIHSYNKIEVIKFTQPRTYRDLPERIGIINFIKFNNNTNNLSQIFIFKNINGEWKIEGQKEIAVRTEGAEASLVRQINKK